LVKGIRDTRVRYFHQDNSGRPAVARNRAIGLARGELLAFLDADDVWLPSKLAQQVSYSERYPHAGLFYSWCVAFNGSRDLHSIGPADNPPKRIFDRLLADLCFFRTSTVMIRRAVLDDVGMFDERDALRAVEDFDLWIRIAHRYDCVFLPAILARYRVHPAGLSADWPAMQVKIRRVLQESFERYDVAPGLRARAMASLSMESFKLGLLGDETAPALIAHLRDALAYKSPGIRDHLLLELAQAGAVPLMRAVYRKRLPLVRARHAWRRLKIRSDVRRRGL
jgi:glycosyltransferase involved in cell wall biosynthesis